MPQPTSKILWLAGIALGVAGMLLAFPPVHIRPMQEVGLKAQAAGFDPASGAAAFWSTHITRAAEHAHEIVELAAKLKAGDAGIPGRRSSVGGEPVFVVKGTGTVVAVEPRAVRVNVSGTHAEVLLRTGPLFGNLLRDAFESPEVATLSSFDANALAAELNKIAEEQVQPRVVESAMPGSVLSFVGATQPKTTPEGHLSIVVIPIDVESEK